MKLIRTSPHCRLPLFRLLTGLMFAPILVLLMPLAARAQGESTAAPPLATPAPSTPATSVAPQPQLPQAGAVAAPGKAAATPGLASSAASSANSALSGGLSETAQRVYARAADKLVQIRILLNGVRSKSEAGSGFYVTPDGLIITNYHVISRLAMQPQRYQAEVVGTDGSVVQGVLMAFDAPQDLAVLRVERRVTGPYFPLLPLAGLSASAATPATSTMPATPAAALAKAAQLINGQRLFSLGNPLDLGFAIAEGTYNGLIEQHFYAQILFTGALNPGMSGGPALDAEGRVIGVNVAKRLDGELTSFLIPVERARVLLARALGTPEANAAAALATAPSVKSQDKPADGKTATGDAQAAAARAAALAQTTPTQTGPPGRATVTEQLLVHQQRVADRLLAAPLPTEPIGAYRVPVSPGEWIRCWAGRPNQDEAYIQIEVNRCSADSGVYVSNELELGELRYQHEYGSASSGLRFLRRHAEGFAQEPVGRRRGNSERGATRCTEEYVKRGPGTLRVVICASAYRKLPGLYDFTLSAASVDRARAGLQTRLQAQGFSYDNGLRIARHFLSAVQWSPESGK